MLECCQEADSGANGTSGFDNPGTCLDAANGTTGTRVVAATYTAGLATNGLQAAAVGRETTGGGKVGPLLCANTLVVLEGVAATPGDCKIPTHQILYNAIVSRYMHTYTTLC